MNRHMADRPSPTALTQDIVAEIVRRILEQRLAVCASVDNSHGLFYSPRAAALKEEIVAVGRKLWQRQYVDGNGGNISARLSADRILCTPTMLSKGDLRMEDLSPVDLENRQVLGNRPQTGEILLHLEI
jgi:L-fuculose-phosphate aldolase